MPKVCHSGHCISIPDDWEKVKCRVGGRRLRTACNTISPADVPKFRRGEIAPWLITDRVGDFQVAWGLREDGDIKTLQPFGNITTADLAELHINNVVPSCLQIEAGRHTCHPGEPPGREFYNLAREVFRQDIREGKFRWRHEPRGGSGGDNPGTQPGDPANPGGKGAPTRKDGGLPLGMIAVGVGALLLLGMARS